MSIAKRFVDPTIVDSRGHASIYCGYCHADMDIYEHGTTTQYCEDCTLAWTLDESDPDMTWIVDIKATRDYQKERLEFERNSEEMKWEIEQTRLKELDAKMFEMHGIRVGGWCGFITEDSDIFQAGIVQTDSYIDERGELVIKVATGGPTNYTRIAKEVWSLSALAEQLRS